MASNSNWRDDDLERGLAADLFNLSGLGVEESQIGAYDMTEVLNLVKEPSLLNDMNVNVSQPNVKTEGSPLKQFKEDPATLRVFSVIVGDVIGDMSMLSAGGDMLD